MRRHWEAYQDCDVELPLELCSDGQWISKASHHCLLTLFLNRIDDQVVIAESIRLCLIVLVDIDDRTSLLVVVKAFVRNSRHIRHPFSSRELFLSYALMGCLYLSSGSYSPHDSEFPLSCASQPGHNQSGGQWGILRADN